MQRAVTRMRGGFHESAAARGRNNPKFQRSPICGFALGGQAALENRKVVAIRRHPLPRLATKGIITIDHKRAMKDRLRQYGTGPKRYALRKTLAQSQVNKTAPAVSSRPSFDASPSSGTQNLTQEPADELARDIERRHALARSGALFCQLHFWPACWLI